MYNAKIAVEYTTDEEYKKALLAVFGRSVYSDDLADDIAAVADHPALQSLKQEIQTSYGVPDDLAALILFSFEHFKTTHALLG